MSRMLMQRVRKEIPATAWQRILRMLPFIAVGGLCGFLIAHYKISTTLIISMGGDQRETIFLDRFQFELSVVITFIAGILVQLLATLLYQKKLYALALKRNKIYNLPQSIALTEKALVAACALGAISCAWHRVTHRYLYKDLQVLIFDQALLVWLPQAEIKAAEGVSGFLDEKTGIALR